MDWKEAKLTANIFITLGLICLALSYIAPQSPENFSKFFGISGGFVAAAGTMIKCFVEYNNS